jgi:hypothetical protein
VKTPKKNTTTCPICRRHYSLPDTQPGIAELARRLLKISRISKAALTISILWMAALTIYDKPTTPRRHPITLMLSAATLIIASTASTWLTTEWTIHQIHTRMADQ